MTRPSDVNEGINQALDSRSELSLRIFFAHVDKTPTCWNWLGTLHKGYGIFTSNGRTEGAHRASWRLNVGEIPTGMCVLHECDNPSCVRPDHLYLGTQLKNIEDRVERGRTNTAAAHVARRKLTEEQVREIWLKRKSGTKLKDLELQYGVSDTCICDIMSGKTWAFLSLNTGEGVGSGSPVASRDKAVNTGRGHASPALENGLPSDSQSLDVADQGKANPRIGSLCVGNPGVSTSARVDAPEENPNAGPYWGLSNLPPSQMTATKFAGERADSPNRQPSPVTQRTAMTSPAIQLEPIARKMQRIAAGGYNSVDRLISRVEEVTCRS